MNYPKIILYMFRRIKKKDILKKFNCDHIFHNLLLITMDKGKFLIRTVLCVDGWQCDWISGQPHTLVYLLLYHSVVYTGYPPLIRSSCLPFPVNIQVRIRGPWSWSLHTRGASTYTAISPLAGICI